MSRRHWLSITKDELEWQTFRAGGKGGQGQNKTDSGVRVIHAASGARGEARDSRSQLRNKRAALRRLTEDPMFKVWLNRMAFGADTTDYSTSPENLKIEYKRDGRWREL